MGGWRDLTSRDGANPERPQVRSPSSAPAPHVPARTQLSVPGDPRRSPAAGRQEQKAGSLLVRVAQEPTMGIGPVVARDLLHPATLGPASLPCLTNPGNYT